MAHNASNQNQSACDSSLQFRCEEAEEAEAEKNYYVLYLLVVPAFTIFGNVLVTMAVAREKQLRTPTGFIIFSLAVADILVGALVMPFCIAVDLERATWLFGDLLCHFYVMCDVMFCTASILHLAAISFDRYIAVLWPIAYSNTEVQRKRVLCMLACTWLLAFFIALPLVTTMDVHRFINATQVYECTFQNDDYLIYSSLFSFYVPFLIMAVLYAKLLRAVRAHTRNSALYKAFSAHSKQFRSILGGAAVAGRSQRLRNRFRLTAYGRDRRVCSKSVPSAVLMLNQSSQSSAANDNNSEASADLSSTPRRPCASAPVPISVTALYAVSRDARPARKTDGRGLAELRTQSQCLLSEGDNGNSNSNSNSNGNGNGNSNSNGDVSAQQMKRAPNSQAAHNLEKRERKVTITLAVVLGVFIGCWLPFFTANILRAVCMKTPEILNLSALCGWPFDYYTTWIWLGYINSMLNPVIYCAGSAEFRKAFLSLLCRTR